MDVDFQTRGRRLTSSCTHWRRAGGPTRSTSMASSSTSRARSSARSPSSSRGPACCRACVPTPGSGEPRRCSTSGTRPPAHPSRSPPRSGGSPNSGQRAERPIEVIHRVFTEPPFVVDGVEPLSLEGLRGVADLARAGGLQWDDHRHQFHDRGQRTRRLDPLPGPARSRPRSGELTPLSVRAAGRRGAGRARRALPRCR